jgi:predicted ATPase
MVNKQGEANMATTPLLDKVLERAAAKGISRAQALVDIASITDQQGLFAPAKHWGVLVNESAADFACEFYETFNNEIYYRY